MSTDDGIFVLLEAQMKMTARVACIIRITLITLKHNTLLVYNEGLCFLCLATELKSLLVNQLCVVYAFQCDSCDWSYIGYTSRHR